MYINLQTNNVFKVMNNIYLFRKARAKQRGRGYNHLFYQHNSIHSFTDTLCVIVKSKEKSDQGKWVRMWPTVW